MTASPPPSAHDADAIVVGAGPAGAATAFHLATAGRRVLLLERRAFPRDKSCGDGLTRMSVRLLSELGVLPRLEGAFAVRGVRVHMRNRGSRDFDYARSEYSTGGLVVPRLRLDHVICMRAVEVGAELREHHDVTGLVHSGAAVTGVQVKTPNGPRTLRARIVVAADGPRSRLAHEAGLVATHQAAFGTAIRAYFDGIDGLDHLLEIHLPLTDPSNRYVLPSYGWVFPTSEGSANVGVGLFERVRAANVRDVFERFLEALLQSDSRFRDVQPRGRWLGAPLRFDFAPDRCAVNGLLVVGDAAGMVSPFTGEGIGYALHSAKLAAAAIDRHLATSAAGGELRAYPAALARHYTGYFETGRHAARRYQLIWHLLEGTFRNERPLFRLARRAALLPEGVGGLYSRDVLDDVSHLLPQLARIRTRLLAVDEMLIDSVRAEWPFLARLSTSSRGGESMPLRAGVLVFLAASYGNDGDPRLPSSAAALELGALAAIALLSADDDGMRLRGAGADWGNAFAVTSGDFFFAKALELTATSDCNITRDLAGGFIQLCRGRVTDLRSAGDPLLDPTAYLGTVDATAGALWDLTVALGATLSGTAAEHAEALRRFARAAGVAYQLSEEAVAAVGPDNGLGEPTMHELRRGVFRLPALLAARGDPAVADRLAAVRGATDEEALAAIRAIRASGAPRRVMHEAEAAAERARQSLAALPWGPARTALDGIASFATTRPAAAPLTRDGG